MRSGGAISYSSALSKGMKVTDEGELDRMVKSALYFHDLSYKLIATKAIADFQMMMARMPRWSHPKCLKAFHAADRTSVLNCIKVEYEKQHEVLELVLTKNFSVGSCFSKQYTTIVEYPDQEELVPLPPPPPKGQAEQICDSVNEFVRKVTLQPRIEPEVDRWVPVESNILEIHLSNGHITSHRISKHVSVFSRRASVEEIMPYKVEFHISQKAWHEKLMIWLTKRAESAAFHSDRYLKTGCGPNQESDAIILSDSTKQVPIEIEITSLGEKPKQPRTLFKAAPSMDGIWIPEFDVVLGVPKTKATTVATDIMTDRIVPFFVSKADLRPSQVHVMTLMLQEELKDHDKFTDKDLPMANFWMKLTDCDESVRSKEGVETKWLRKDNGDFIGPFVHASDDAIHQAAIEWLKQPEAQKLAEEPRDPEPSPTSSPTPPCYEALFTNALEEEKPEERVRADREKLEQAVATMARNDQLGLFNMTGPIESLDQKAKEVCQEWVDDSETLLIKAAKKTLIDSFQADFQSFLFLFQLQLKRIKGGYDNNSTGADACSVSQGDDTSWVSAQPSVQEEDTRVADIESACVAFMNQIGNDMVKHYERLSGDQASNNSVVGEEFRDEQEAEGERGALAAYLKRHSSPRGGSSVQSKKKLEVEPRRQGRDNADPSTDPALVLKDEVSTHVDSKASTVQRFTKKVGIKAMNRHGEPPKGRREAPPASFRRRREDDISSDEEDNGYSVTDEEWTEESLASYDDDEEEEERSYERGRGRRPVRGHPSRDFRAKGRRRGRRRYDYESPCSRSRSDDDTFPTVETEPLESLTISPSELSYEEKPKGWGLSFWM